ncbi:MAG TPA: alpha-ribazole phosphatase [Ktedonobacteraceae bacterium]|jgi:alpha-ribazole phosphatase|nr:alpha-ribazole phosphatase [Ktedonobacteraceae bacterium]
MDKTGIKATAKGAYVEQSVQRLWLVRHGVTRWNIEQRFCGQSDIPLAPRGRVQARWLARRLQSERIAAIYSSDLQRARETAEIIAQRQPGMAPVTISPCWREINFGAWEGLSYEQIARNFEQHAGFFSDPQHCATPGGESLADVLRRVNRGLSEIAANARTTRGDVVVVSHGGTLRALLCRALGMPLDRQWQLRLDPGSLSAIDLLPMSDAALPQAILVFLNVQRPKRPRHPGTRFNKSIRQ